MVQSILECKNICYRIGQRNILKDINWKVQPKENWLVFGMNGSGKTTLFGIIAGFLSPTSGNICVFGEPYTSKNIFDLRRKIGWVSNSFFDRIYREEDVLSIVLSGLFGTFSPEYGVKAKDVRFAKELLNEFQLIEKIGTPFSKMSKGERQSVLLARALISRPELLILDEPCSGLDIYAREHLKQTVKELTKEEKATVLYVTHYPDEIQDSLKKSMLLKNGKIFAIGATEDVITTENLSKLLKHPTTVTYQKENIDIQINVKSRILNLCYPKSNDEGKNSG